jgi:putative two-component system response regulator
VSANMPPNNGPLGTVLVADDNQAARDVVEIMLRTHGYRVVSAADGPQALALLEQESVDVALIDSIMPGQSGFAVCRAAKDRPETRLTPIVLITALGRAEDRIRATEAGADEFLNKPVRKEELLARVKSLARIKRFTDELESAETVVFTLAASIEAKDPYTEGHCDRLSRYSVALGKRLGLSIDECTALRCGGVVHDIGKVAVPERVLLKPRPLDAHERELMEKHPVIGERICAPLKSFCQVLPIIRWHHERQDGSGYPDHLKGDQIPITARVLQTADIYDALTTDRPYRKALPAERAFAILRDEVRRGWWDGALVNEFEALLKELPEDWATQAGMPVLGSISALGSPNGSAGKPRRLRIQRARSEEAREALITS